MRGLIAILFITAMIMLGGCAAPASKHPGSYISPAQFQTYNCEELLAEINRIQTRVGELLGRSNDPAPAQGKWLLGADLSLSWPALFALGGTKEQEAEYAQLKNEYDTIQRLALDKQCPGVIPPAEKPPEFDPDLVEISQPSTIAGQR